MLTRARHAWQHLSELPALCRAVYPDAPLHRPGPSQWLLARSVRHFRQHLALVDGLSQAHADGLLRQRPELMRKLHSQYPFHGLTPPQRLAWLLGHLASANALFGPALAARLLTGEPVAAARINLPDGAGQLPVWLQTARRKHLREGDLTLELQDPWGTKLYALTCTLQPCEGGHELLIGALQGQMPLPLTRHLTKLSEGVRPMALMLFLAQCLAERLGVQRLRACGRGRHIHHGGERAEQVRFDYDAFWQEAGGVADDAGFFTLPIVAARRAPEEVPSHKRAQYRRRYAWLDSLRVQMREVLDASLPPLAAQGPVAAPTDAGGRAV